MEKFERLILDEAEYWTPQRRMKEDVVRFEELYDGGKIFFVKQNYEFFLMQTHIPLSRFIYEGNYQYYQQTMRMPWLFVRWFCVPRGNELKGVFDTLTQSDAFQRYFEWKASTEKFVFYRLKENVLRADAEEGGLHADVIPSLQLSMESWEPTTILWDMGFPGDGSPAAAYLFK